MTMSLPDHYVEDELWVYQRIKKYLQAIAVNRTRSSRTFQTSCTSDREGSYTDGLETGRA